MDDGVRMTWARRFLEEDSEMGDPLFYPRLWQRLRTEASMTNDYNPIDRNLRIKPEGDTMNTAKVAQLDDETARLNALMALSAAADKARNQQILREQFAPAEQERDQQALEDEYYGHQVLLNNGICPECLWPLAECECGLTVNETEQYGDAEATDDEL